MTAVAPVVMPASKAARWIGSSLEQGDGLSVEVLRKGQLSTGVHVGFVPSTLDVDHLEINEGDVASMRSADDALAKFLRQMALAKPTGLVVENDLSRRLDPALASLSLPRVYFGDRVLHWREVSTDDPASAVELLRRGASGYPGNGFLLEAQVLQDLWIDGEVDAAWCVGAVRSLVGVVTVAFDGESFVLWLQPELAGELGLITSG